MNVFEDLIVELKQANLLERTIIDDQVHNEDEDLSHLEETAVPSSATEEQFEAADIETDFAISVDSGLRQPVVPLPTESEPLVHRKPRNGQEFYRKRAMAEVSNLQMVDHVISGVEREYMKVVPRTYDDFAAKKALNSFLQVSEGENSIAHKEAEFGLMSETEAWCTALAERDKSVKVADIRQYCENSKPPLSSQALVALGRFYRNLPYSGTVSAKFDFVITRLFSRPAVGESRMCVFSSEEMLVHIHTLYKDWSSIALYEEGDDSNISLSCRSFEEFAAEAENAVSFDALIEADFFSRVRRFKESIGELFYAPRVLAAAVQANVKIGNAYVSLIGREHDKGRIENLHSRYGDRHDDSIAAGIGRTLELVELLKAPTKPDLVPLENRESPSDAGSRMSAPNQTSEPTQAAESPTSRPPILEMLVDSVRNVNRWLVLTCGLLIAASIGIYIYANTSGAEKIQNDGVSAMSIDNPVYKDYVTIGRLTDQTLYGIVLPSWNGLSQDRKQEILAAVFRDGKEKGYSKVNLINEDGKPVGFASATRLEVIK